MPAILQSTVDRLVGSRRLVILDGDGARWVTKGKRRVRARQAEGYELVVTPSTRPPGSHHAWFSRYTYHRFPRGAFWLFGPWDRTQQPYDPGWGVGGAFDERTGEFRWEKGAFWGRNVDESALMALDTLTEIYLRGAPPEGVYDLDSVIARANPVDATGRRYGEGSRNTPTTINYRRSRGGLERLISVFGDGWTVHTGARRGPRGHLVWDMSGQNWAAGPMLSVTGYGRVSPMGDVRVERVVAHPPDGTDRDVTDSDAFEEVMGSWLDAFVPLWLGRQPPEGSYPFPVHPSPPFEDEAAALAARRAAIAPPRRRRQGR